MITSNRSLLKEAFGAAVGAAVAGLVLTGGQAKAIVTVNVGGLDYDVTTFTGSYNDNISKFTLTDMPWFTGGNGLADAFALAVGFSFGEPNIGVPPDNSGKTAPLFSYTPSLAAGRRVGWGIQVVQPRPASVYTYAILATPPAPSPVGGGTASVPGPLPALGLAAAFGFSRQLRKRIKSSTNSVPNTSAS